MKIVTKNYQNCNKNFQTRISGQKICDKYDTKIAQIFNEIRK